jgi:hypothetical protein
MTAWDVVQELHRLGIELIREGDDLRVRPSGVLTPQLRAELKRHKQEILEALSVPPPRDASPEADRLRSEILRWLDRRWTPDQSWPAVYPLVEAGATPWREFYEQADVTELRRCLDLIRQEDALLGEASPWRT